MPLAAESYYAAVGSFCLCPAHALQAILHHRKEAGKCVLCRHVPWKASSPQILLRRGRNFGLCPAHSLQAIPHHRKEAGKRVLCSDAPEEAACGRIVSRRGRNFLRRPSLPQPLSKFASPPPSGARGQSPPGWGAELRASIQVFYRNVEARILHRAGACASVFVLGLVVLSRGKAKRERSSLGALACHSRAHPLKRTGTACLKNCDMYVLFGDLGSMLTVPLPMFGWYLMIQAWTICNVFWIYIYIHYIYLYISISRDVPLDKYLISV